MSSGLHNSAALFFKGEGELALEFADAFAAAEVFVELTKSEGAGVSGDGGLQSSDLLLVESGEFVNDVGRALHGIAQLSS